MQPHFASIKAGALRSPVLIQAMGSLGVVPSVAVGLSSDGEGVVIELNDDFKGEVIFKDGPPLSPAKSGSRKRHRRSCGANETIEVQIIEDGGRPRSVARVRTADVGGIIGPALAWNGGKEWGERTFDLATDAKTKGFGSAGAPFTESAAPLSKLVLQKLFSWADDEVEERFEVSDERSGASRTTLALCPPSRRASSFLSHPSPLGARRSARRCTLASLPTSSTASSPTTFSPSAARSTRCASCSRSRRCGATQRPPTPLLHRPSRRRLLPHDVRAPDLRSPTSLRAAHVAPSGAERGAARHPGDGRDGQPPLPGRL